MSVVDSHDHGNCELRDQLESQLCAAQAKLAKTNDLVRTLQPMVEHLVGLDMPLLREKIANYDAPDAVTEKP